LPTTEEDHVDIVRRLTPIELEDTRGGRSALGAFWRDRPVVLVFLRHFG